MFSSSKHYAKICAVPQAAGAWPIVGHLHLFRVHQLTHKTLGTMAEKLWTNFHNKTWFIQSSGVE